MQDKRVPIISVILPVYNGADFLAQAIESILNQTHSDFELIIIDDGSTDESLKVINLYAAKDERIVVIGRDNKGLVATLNEGIKVARGAWIARMDADDISLPKRFETQLLELENKHADICGSWVRRFGGFDNRVVKLPQTEEAIKMEMLFGTPLAHPTVMVRAEVLKANPYNANFSNAEDYDLWARLIESGYKLVNVQEVLLHYRVHGMQVSVQAENQQYKQGQEIRKRYWLYLFNSFSLDIKLIDDVLKVFDSSEKSLNINFVDSVFASLLHVSNGEARALLLGQLSKIYIKKSVNFPDNLSRWQSINNEFGSGLGLVVSFKIIIFRAFKIQEGGAILNNLKNVSNFLR